MLHDLRTDPIFKIAKTRPLSPDEVGVYLNIKQRINAMEAPNDAPGKYSDNQP